MTWAWIAAALVNLGYAVKVYPDAGPAVIHGLFAVVAAGIAERVWRR